MAYSEKISFSVDCSKINKEKLKDGKYLNLTLVPTPSSQYNEYMVSQYMGKDESGNIVGNGDDLQTVMDKFSKGSSTSPQPMKLSESSEDGLPF